MDPKSQEIIGKRKELMLPSTHDDRFPIAIEKGLGIYIWDFDGKKFLDWTSQVGIASIGHCHPKVVQAVKDQAEKLMACIGSDFDNEPQVRLAEKLIKITPGGPSKKVWLDVGGAEGIIAAVEFLLHVRPERRHFISFYGGFHGRKGYAKDLTCSKTIQKLGYQPSLMVHHLLYDMNPDDLEDLFKHCVDPREVNAVALEFLQGEGGIESPDRQNLFDFLEVCNEYDIKIIDDEIQSGLGRTGEMWACEHFGVTPDILVTSKALGSGLPISGTIILKDRFGDWEKDVMTKLPRSWHSLTFMGPPLSCAAALATIEVIEKEKLVENAQSMGYHLLNRLRLIALNKSSRLLAKGRGLMTGLQFKCINGDPDVLARNQTIQKAFDQRLLLIGAGHPEKNPTIRFMPPLCINENQVDAAMNIVGGILEI